MTSLVHTFVDYLAYFLGLFGGLIAVWQGRIWLVEWRENRIDSLASVDRHGLILIDQIKAAGFKPDFVLGIGRSGAFLGGWIAGNLGTLPIEVVDRRHEDEKTELQYPGIEDKLQIMRRLYGNSANVLIVEGATTSGTTLNRCSQLINKHASEWTCKYAVIYEIMTSRFPTDFVARRIKHAPRRYPWHKTVDWRPFLGRTTKITIVS